MFDFIYTYDEFKGWDDEEEGMEIIEHDPDNMRANGYDDITYAIKDGYRLRIRMFLPETKDDSRKYPLIMHVKGSAWMEQNLSSHVGDYADIVRAGFGVAFIQYRPITVARFPAQILDVKTAARYLLRHADEYPIDFNNLFLAGDSSGGHTAIMDYLTWNEDVLDNEDEEGPLPPIRGLIDIYGVTDVRDLCYRETGMSQKSNYDLAKELFEKQPIEDYPEQYAEANAFCYIDLRENKEPVLILHGNKDRLVPLSHSTRFFRELKERGVKARLFVIDKGDHGHATFWNREVIGRMIEFLRENTK